MDWFVKKILAPRPHLFIKNKLDKDYIYNKMTWLYVILYFILFFIWIKFGVSNSTRNIDIIPIYHLRGVEPC